jgi:hypothetical protein
MKAADLSDEPLFAVDADPVRLSRRIRGELRDSPAHLGEAGTRLYDVLLEECCDCFVRVVRQLPEFTARAETEMLGRLSGMGEQIATALDRLPVRTLDAPSGTGCDAEFERRYLEFVSTASTSCSSAFCESARRTARPRQAAGSHRRLSRTPHR